MYCDARMGQTNIGALEEAKNLIDAHFVDGNLSADQFSRLQQILRECQAAREYFVEQAVLEFRLHRVFSEAP